MAPSATERAQTPPRDDLDDLFDYDVDGKDLFRPLSPAKAQPQKKNGKDSDAGGLGIEEEVEVTKKARAPRVKLDDTRLMSDAGIPKLRKKAKSLKFKGKGHEFSDAQRLLTFYQLWLDDLFPKARFLDALAMVEKAGHKKALQMKRQDWIRENRPKPSYEQNENIFEDPTVELRRGQAIEDEGSANLPAETRFKTPAMGMDLDEDIYGATPLATRIKPTETNSLFVADSTKTTETANVEDDIPFDDDLDALLAEENVSTKDPAVAAVPVPGSTRDNEPDEDELAEMDGLW